MANEKSDKKQPKRPTALKRDMQNVRRQARNRAFKSSVRTATNAFTNALKASPEEAKKAFLHLQSLMDKGVKKGIYQVNKAARIKSKLSQQLTTKA